MTVFQIHISLIGTAPLFLSACTMGTDYAKREVAAPTEWIASLPHEGHVE